MDNEDTNRHRVSRGQALEFFTRLFILGLVFSIEVIFPNLAVFLTSFLSLGLIFIRR
jgi:hypothetical protein